MSRVRDSTEEQERRSRSTPTVKKVALAVATMSPWSKGSSHLGGGDTAADTTEMARLSSS